MDRRGIEWIVITTEGEQPFTTIEYMINYIRANADIVISITHITEGR